MENLALPSTDTTDFATDETVWEIGDQRVVNRDCIAALNELPAESIDVVVTSPPYNIRLNYLQYRDDLPREHYLEWMRNVGAALARVMKDDGSFFLNVSGTNSDPWMPFELVLALRETFALQNHIVWVKSISIDQDTYGHFKPINSERYLNHNHEHIFHFTKSGETRLDRLAVGVPFKDKSNISRWGHARDRRCAGNVWFIPYQTVQSKAEKFHHPGTYPVELPQRCIRLHGRKSATVLDPFLGTGTTLVAAQMEGCFGIGLELDRSYCQVAVERLKLGI